MDNLWERSIPFYNLEIKEILDIFKEYDKHFEIFNYNRINVGCRNSNYKVSTNKGCFFLRICALNDSSFKKEKIISETFYGPIKIPKLLYVSEDNVTRRTCLIYEYIHGNSLQELQAQIGNFEDDTIIQVAESASYIHNCDILFNEEINIDCPPFLTWYDLFLDKELVTERIGKDVHKRVKKMLENKRKELHEINSYISFIHSDFRPANMLIDKSRNIWIVDWEFSGFGHSLADIGQFFRYVDCFEPRQIKVFEETYNRNSNRNLPSDWYELSKLRDLVNPLQMLGAKENLPQKYMDLKKLIIDICNFFGY